jgi:transcriptional regulator with XRE-family HTH domain
VKGPEVMKPRSEWSEWEIAFYQALSERLRLTRKLLRVSEQEAADAAGVTVKTYQKWESGATAPRCGFIENFCDELEVSIDWLLSGEGEFLFERHYLDDLVRWAPDERQFTDAGRPFIPAVIVKH